MTSPANPIKLYRHPLSGHAHRAQLALSLLGLPVELVEVDLLAGAHKRTDFLAMNLFGQVPVLDDDGLIVPDSNAILVYLARRYDPTNTWLPLDPMGQAAVQRWLSIAAGPLASGPATARLITVFGSKANAADTIGRSHQLLAVVDAALADTSFLVGEGPTLADIAMYTYVAHAPEGNVSLETYPHVRSWLARIEALPGFVPMQKTAIGMAV